MVRVMVKNRFMVKVMVRVVDRDRVMIDLWFIVLKLVLGLCLYMEMVRV